MSDDIKVEMREPKNFREAFDGMVESTRQMIADYDRDPKPEDQALTRYIDSLRDGLRVYDEGERRKKRERADERLSAFDQMPRYKGLRLSAELGDLDEWDRWREEAPYIEFPTGWKVKPIAPFQGAQARFLVQLPGMPAEERVSVYLDCYNRLGYFGSPYKGPEPYWEVYPHQGDVGRCAMQDVDRLIEMIADRSERAAEEPEDV